MLGQSLAGLKRRQILTGAATLAASGACGREPESAPTGAAAEAPAASPAPPSPAPTGRILGFGIASGDIQARFESAARGRPSSVLIDTDLATGQTRHTPLAVAEGHEPVLLADGQLVCVSDGGERILFIDPATHAITETVQCDPGFEYSGHARMVDEHLVVTVRQRGDGKMRGRLDVFSPSTKERVRSVDTGGHVPHEIVVLEDRNEIAISHYGHFGGEHFRNGPFYWDVKEAAVTFLDRHSLAFKRRFVYGKPLALTHMRRAKTGELYVVAAQYVRNDPAGLSALEAAGPEDPPFEIAPLERRTGRIGVPGPVVVIDPERGIVDELMPEPRHHRKQQSLAVHEHSGNIFVTFTYSDRVMRIDPETKSTTYIAAADLGIAAPCGVVDLDGTPFVAISGRTSGLVIVDAATANVVRTYPTEMFSNVHLGYAKA